MEWVVQWAAASGRSLLITGLMLVFLVVLEQWLPRKAYSLRDRKLGAMIWLLGVPLGFALSMPLVMMWTAIRPAEPLLTLDFAAWLSWMGPLKWLAAAAGVILVTDLFGYWFHRIQHGPLWPVHAVHHSIEDLHAVSAYRHPIDAAFQFVLVFAPMSLLPFGAGPEVLIVSVLTSLQLNFIHCPVQVTFGPLRYFLVDNAFHRIHHSVEPRHFGKNYGVLTTVWDQVFRTAYFPAKDEWPDTGLAEIREPRSIREWLDLPVRMIRRPRHQPL